MGAIPGQTNAPGWRGGMAEVGPTATPRAIGVVKIPAELLPVPGRLGEEVPKDPRCADAGRRWP
eukprot:3880886-Lingulodinium_polyedra.AAC.1